MDTGLSLDPRLEVFRQKMFIVFPLLKEKKPKTSDMPIPLPHLKLCYKI